MRCYELDEFLSEYLEGDLSPEKTEELLAHLETCEACRAEFQAYKTQDERLGRYYKRELDRSRIEENPLLKTPDEVAPVVVTKAWRGARYLQAVAALLVLGLGIGVYQIYRQAAPTGSAGLATVQTARGRVQLLEANSLQSLEVGSRIRQAQCVKAGNGAYAALTLNDGNTLEVRGGTQLSLRDFPNRLEVALNGGQVWAHLGHRPKKPFVVTTAHLKATAVGTVFSVEQGLDRSVVMVAKGKVLVECGGTQTSLAAGEQFSSLRGSEKARVADATDWSEQKQDLASLEKTAETAEARPLLNAEKAAPAAVVAESSTPEARVTAPATPRGMGIDNLIDLLPDDTRYFLDVRSWAELRKEFGRTDYAALKKETSIQTWWQSMKGQKVFDEASSQIHLPILMELSKLLDGQVVMGVDPKGNFLLVANCESHEQEVRDSLQKLSGAVATDYTKEHPQNATSRILAQSEVEQRILVERGRLIVSTNPALARETCDRLMSGRRTKFADSAFRHKLMANVNNPPFMMAADLATVIKEQLPRPEAQPTTATQLTTATESLVEMLGVRGIDYLLISPSFIGRGMNQAARIGFAGDRYGAMNWLGEPSPMRSLEFLSPDVHFFASGIVNNPSEALIHYLLFLQSSQETSQYESVSAFMANYQDLLKAFGGEITIAVENPLLPIPNIKIIAEMADRKAFEEGLMRLTDDMRKKWDSDGTMSYLEGSEYKGYTINTLYINAFHFSPSYAFVNDYLVMGPGRQFVQSAIDVYTSRRSIAQDSRLASLLPGKADMNFSLLIYQDIAKAIPSLVRSKITPQMDPEALKMVPDVDFLERYRAPGIAYACARRSYIDLYLSTPKGIDFNMGMAVPMIANWLTPKDDPLVIAKKVAEAQVGLSLVKDAAEKFQAEKGKLPGSMSELAGKYLDKAPIDPFALKEGDTLRFARGPKPNQITIYSIGPDETDDAGVIPFELGKPDKTGDVLMRIPEDEAPKAAASAPAKSGQGPATAK